MADSSPWDRAVPVGDSSDPWSRAVPIAAPTGPGQGGIPTAAQEALQQPDIDPVSMVANAPTLGMPAVMGELARPFIHHYIGENVEKATGSPTAGLASELATPILAGNLPRLGGTLAREFAAAPSAQELEEVGTEAAEKAQKALASGEADVHAAASNAYKKAGDEALSQIAPIAKSKAEDEAVSQISKGVGVDPAQRQKEAQAAYDNPELARQSALGRQESKLSAAKPVGRLFEQKGQQIGEVLKDHADIPLSTENLSDTTAEIRGQIEKHQYITTPAVAKQIEQAEQEATAGHMTLSQAIGRQREMQRMNFAASKPGDEYALGQLEAHYQNMVDSAVKDLPEDVQKEYGAVKGEYGDLKSGLGKVGKDVYSQADQPAVAKKLLGLSRDHYSQLFAEANPQEQNTLGNTLGRYIMGDEAKPDAEGVVKRFKEVRDKDPEGFRRLYGDSAFQQADTWADVAKKTQKFTEDMRSDPSLAAGWLHGTGLAQGSPEAQRLDAAIEKVRSLPKPQQQALEAKIKLIQDGTGGRMYGYIKRRLMFDTLLYGGSAAQYGMLAKNPAFAAGLAGFIGSREVTASLVKNHPEAYLNIVKRMNGTVQGMRQAGYFAARMTAADMAREIEDAMTGPQRQPQEQGQ